MSEATPNFEPAPSGSPSTESIPDKYGSIYSEDGLSFAVTDDGEGIVPVSGELAERITLALKLQDKVFSGKYPRLARLLEVLNCRKTALTAAGSMDMSEATDRQHEDLSGVKTLFADVERLQSEGHFPQVFEDGSTGMNDALNNYNGGFPVIVHLFGVEKDSPVDSVLDLDIDLSDGFVSPEVVGSLHRDHSFLVLGKDESDYVCFQRVAAGTNQPFTISHLPKVIQPYVQDDARKMVAFLGPTA